jgi:Family of unknown function (DUF5690)
MFWSRLSSWTRHPAWALTAAFGTYFCMYGFRKPYTAATYSEMHFLGMNVKELLVISQTMGYLAAKWWGIKIVSEIRPGHRIPLLLGLIALAEAMWLLFGLAPPPLKLLFILLNGLPLGIVFGTLLGFLEGRNNSEALLAGLCASFIVSDGLSKSIGATLLQTGISENWMPFLAGLIFLGPMLFFIAMLSRIPPPSAEDTMMRSERPPMTGKDRNSFFFKYGLGISGIAMAYLLATFLRSIRADFATEIWSGLGFSRAPAIFTQSELIVGIGVTAVSGLTMYIRNHIRAFEFSLFCGLVGFLICLVAVGGLSGGLDPFLFMVLIGLGVYIPYVGIHTTIVERLIATTREKANIGFLMSIMDSVGYTGYAMLLLFQVLYPSPESMLQVFLKLCLIFGVMGALVMFLSYIYFKALWRNNEGRYEQLSPR